MQFIKKVAEYILREELDALHGEIICLRQDLDRKDVDYSKVSASKFVDYILERPIEWIKWRELNADQRQFWSNNAQAILNNPVFQSLIGKEGTNGELVKMIIDNSFRQSKNYDMIKDARMTINGIELIREKLQEMLYNKPIETHDEINSAI